MDEVDNEDLAIEQYLRLTQESQTPKKIKDMTIAEYLEYEKKEFAPYFDPNQPDIESDCYSEDMEEEVEYMTDDEVGVENMKDALISSIKSIKQEMKDGIMKRQFEASTARVSDEVSSITNNEVDRADDNTLNTAPCRLTKELSP
ncbi:hypothetical protein Tco_0488677 [Tanacetum coccineum]